MRTQIMCDHARQYHLKPSPAHAPTMNRPGIVILAIASITVLAMSGPVERARAGPPGDSPTPSGNIELLLDFMTDGTQAARSALDRGRAAIAGTQFRALIDRWYADLNRASWMSSFILTRLPDALSLLSVGRRLVKDGRILDQEDYLIIERTLQILDRESAPAPAGFLVETLKRLRASIGGTWGAICATLSTPYDGAPTEVDK